MGKMQPPRFHPQRRTSPGPIYVLHALGHLPVSSISRGMSALIRRKSRLHAPIVHDASPEEIYFCGTSRNYTPLRCQHLDNEARDEKVQAVLHQPELQESARIPWRITLALQQLAPCVRGQTPLATLITPL